MEQPLRILHVEDSEDDAALVERELKRGGFSPAIQRVDTRAAMLAELQQSAWDVILCDYKLPRFSGPDALQLYNELDLDIPFIVISGTVGEESAVEMMRTGAHDYLMKDRLARLVPAVRRELSEAEHRRERRRAEQTLRENEENLNNIYELTPYAITIADENGRYLSVNAAACSELGYTREELLNLTIMDITTPPYLPQVVTGLKSMKATPGFVESGILCKDGSQKPIEVGARPIIYQDRPAMLSVWRNITERKRAEAEKEEYNRFLKKVNQLAVELAALPPDADLVPFAADKIKQLTAASMVVISEYSRSKKGLSTPYFTVSNRWIERVNRILGKNIREASFHLSDDAYQEMVSTIVGWRTSISEISFGSVPEAAGAAVQKLLQVDKFAGLAFVYQDELMGSGMLAFKKGQPPPSDELLRAIAHLVALTWRRKKAEEARDESENRFRGLADLLPLSVFECDLQGLLTYANRQAVELLGFMSQDILLGKLNLLNLVAEKDRKRAAFALWLVKKDRPANAGAEFTAVRKDGSTFPVIIYSSPIKSAGVVLGLRGVVVDISQQKQAQFTLERFAARMEILHQVDRSILNAHSPEEIALASLKGIQFLVSFKQADVILFDFQTSEMITLAQIGPVVNAVRRPIECWNHFKTLTTGQQMVLEDITKDEQYSRVCSGCIFSGIRSMLCMPLLYREKLIGTLNMCRETVGGFLDDDIEIARELADQLSISIQQSRLFLENQHRVQELTGLHDISLGLNTLAHIDETIAALAQKIAHLTAAERCLIVLRDDQGRLHPQLPGFGLREDEIARLSIDFSAAEISVILDREGFFKAESADDLPGKFHQLGVALNVRNLLVVPLKTEQRLLGSVILADKPGGFQSDDVRLLTVIATQTASVIMNARLFDQAQASAGEVMDAYNATIEGWSIALELRDKETRGHSGRVTSLALALADQMGIHGQDREHFRRGVFLHDIGKMGIPDSILLKPGPLSEDEWVIMRQHPHYAHRILSGIPYLQPALDIPYCHHERWDGSGYPRGLKGVEIPLAARIFAVVDVWDALTSDRPYRPAWSEKETSDYIRRNASVQFDPQVVELFLDMVS